MQLDKHTVNFVFQVIWTIKLTLEDKCTTIRGKKSLICSNSIEDMNLTRGMRETKVLIFTQLCFNHIVDKSKLTNRSVSTQYVMDFSIYTGSSKHTKQERVMTYLRAILHDLL